MWRRVPRSEGPGQVSPDDFRSDTTVLAPRSVAVCRLPAAERKAQDGHEWPLGIKIGRQAGAFPVIQENFAAMVCKAGRIGTRTIPESASGPSRP